MPKLTEIEGCIATGRGGVKEKLQKISVRKDSTKKDIYKTVLAAKRFIDKNYSDPINLSQIAKASGVSPFKLNREFKQVFVVAPGQYLTERRIMAAKILLRKTKTSVLDIALKVGWGSVTSFNKAFRQSTGLTPLEYRKKAI